MQLVLDILLVLSVVTNIVLAFYVLLTKRKSNYGVSFFILCIGITLWITSNYFFQNTDNLDQAFFFDRLANVGALILSTGMYFFTKYFPQTTSQKTRLLLHDYGFLFVFSIFALLSFFTNSVDEKVILNPLTGYKEIVTGPLKNILYVLIVSGLVLSIWHLIRSYRTLKGLFRLQIGIFTISFSVSLIGGVFFNLVLPSQGNFNFITLGPAFTVCVALGSVYCMVSYRFADFKVLFSELFEKVSLATFFTASILLINLIVRTYFGSSVMLFIAFNFVYGILFLLIVTYLVRNSKKKALFIPDLNYVVEVFRDRALNISNLSELNRGFTTLIQRYTGLEKINIIVFDQEHRHLEVQYKNILSKITEPILIYEEELKKSIDGDENSNPELFDEINKLSGTNVNMVVKLTYLNELIGVLLLGNKISNQAFTKYEIDFIEDLTDLYSVYLYKLRLLNDIQGFNKVLQSKVNEATKTLQLQKAQLQEKYQFEKDMMGIMGHELRTPMTVAKGMAELVMSKAQTGDEIEKEYLMDKLQKIFTSVVKESDLIQTMLSTSHIDNNKMNFQFTKFDIVELINYSMMAFKKDAENKGLELTFVEPDFKVPEIISDQNRIQEIVNNLISNAVKYTNEGSITVMLEKEGDFLLYSVKDTGIGIPKEEIKNIGKKFYRIHQHLDEKKDVVRAGGTGLGLYVVKGLLKALGGELRVESVEGKGSTFTAVIPIEAKQTDKAFVTDKPVDEHDMFEKMGLNT